MDKEELLPRTFSDETNREWEVRAIHPRRTERRAPLVAADLANGWLLFTLGLERRRLAPLPPGWHEASEVQLKRWCADAEQVAASSHDIRRA